MSNINCKCEISEVPQVLDISIVHTVLAMEAEYRQITVMCFYKSQNLT